MPRPRRLRRVNFNPEITYFKPAGVRLNELEEVILTLPELESLRLKDAEGLDQNQAAEKMQISQPTFHRLVLEARKKVASALVKGRAIKIEGGNYKMPGGDGRGPVGPGEGRGRGFWGGTQNVGPVGVCVCSSCGHEEQHIGGQPCNKRKCPKCEKLMTRK